MSRRLLFPFSSFFFFPLIRDFFLPSRRHLEMRRARTDVMYSLLPPFSSLSFSFLSLHCNCAKLIAHRRDRSTEAATSNFFSLLSPFFFSLGNAFSPLLRGRSTSGGRPRPSYTKGKQTYLSFSFPPLFSSYPLVFPPPPSFLRPLIRAGSVKMVFGRLPIKSRFFLSPLSFFFSRSPFFFSLSLAARSVSRQYEWIEISPRWPDVSLSFCPFSPMEDLPFPS